MKCIFLGDSQSYCAADGPPKKDDLFTGYFVSLQELYDSGGVNFDVFGSGFPLVDTIAPIFHGQNRVLGLKIDQPQKVIGRGDVLAIGMEENDDFGFGSSEEEARNELFPLNFVFNVQTGLEYSRILVSRFGQGL